MANEISMTLGLQVSKAGVADTLNPGVKQFNMTGTNITRATQSIGFAAAEAIAKGDIGTVGLLLIHNLDATNYVQLFGDNTAALPTVRLRPGGYALFELDANAVLFAQANTGACKVESLIVEL